MGDGTGLSTQDSTRFPPAETLTDVSYAAFSELDVIAEYSESAEYEHEMQVEDAGSTSTYEDEMRVEVEDTEVGAESAAASAAASVVQASVVHDASPVGQNRRGSRRDDIYGVRGNAC